MDGVLVIDKPEGLTSHDVVAAARRALREKRIGHTGTLDPLATGVLPLACGKATRLVRFLSASDKDYQATVRFGITTDTYDITGTETGRVPGPVRRTEVESALETLKGEYLQTPPPYSAKKVDGVRAYALARAAQPVALKAVPVRVSAVELVDMTGDQAIIRLTCSAGFYVRSFAHSLGQAVGTGACLEALRRTRSGEFTAEAAVGLDELLVDPEAAAGWLVPLNQLLSRFAAITVNDEGRLRVAHGRELLPAHFTGTPAGWTRILDGEGRLLGLGRSGQGTDSLHPEVVLA